MASDQATSTQPCTHPRSAIEKFVKYNQYGHCGGRRHVGLPGQHRVHRRKLRQHDEGEEQHQVVEREDAQDAARIEGGEIALAAPGVEQDPGNQKTGQHEEEIDAGPAEKQHVADQCVDTGGRPVVA